MTRSELLALADEILLDAAAPPYLLLAAFACARRNDCDELESMWAEAAGVSE